MVESSSNKATLGLKGESRCQEEGGQGGQRGCDVALCAWATSVLGHHGAEGNCSSPTPSCQLEDAHSPDHLSSSALGGSCLSLAATASAFAFSAGDLVTLNLCFLDPSRLWLFEALASAVLTIVGPRGYRRVCQDDCIRPCIRQQAEEPVVLREATQTYIEKVTQGNVITTVTVFSSVSVIVKLDPVGLAH